MNLSQLKFDELNRKLNSLNREFALWSKESSTDAKMQKHHTQIWRITSQLYGLQEAIRQDLTNIKNDDAAILEKAREFEMTILEVHRIWEFFRNKFAIRSIHWFSSYLAMADDFAYECYHSAREKLKEDLIAPQELKEPPLVYFNGGSSPFTLSRATGYRAEEVFDEKIRTAKAFEVLRKLPIPVIGIPWFQIQHLPEALVIGHEVGHDVEEDFRLTDTIESLLEEGMKNASVDEERKPAWRAWLREIFADIYGSLASGPAFVKVLMNFLATDKEVIINDRRDASGWGNYPTDYLRILINSEVLKCQGFTIESENLRDIWKATYGSHSMGDFESDIPEIVDLLVCGIYPEFNDKSLKDVLSFSQDAHMAALDDSELILRGRYPKTDDIRILLSSASLAYLENPSLYNSKEAHDIVLKKAELIRKEGVRNVSSQYDKVNRLSKEQLEQHDISAGKNFLNVLTSR